MSNPGCAEAADPSTLQWAPAANYTYRGLEQWGYAEGATNSYNGSASYVTGSHNIKVGYQYYWLRQLDETIAADNQLLYRAQRGVMNQVTYRLPTRSNNTVTQLHGIFAQDQYTRGRLTLSGAVRWDRASSYAPVEGNGVSESSFLNPTVVTLEKTAGVDAYNDISPRIGVGYDVFGNGKTALKLRWGKYLGLCVERSSLHVDKHRGHDRGDGQPRVDGQRSRQSRGLRPAEQRGAGADARRDEVRHGGHLRGRRPAPARTSARPERQPSSIRTSSRAGAYAPTTIRPRSRCSTKSCRACRLRSATSTARSTASW